MTCLETQQLLRGTFLSTNVSLEEMFHILLFNINLTFQYGKKKSLKIAFMYLF